MARIIGCECSDYQLTQVGCDCGAQDKPVMIVEFWPKGYASEEGLKRLLVAEGVDYQQEVRKAGYPYASTPYVRPLVSNVKPVDNATARYYTKGDNT